MVVIAIACLLSFVLLSQEISSLLSLYGFHVGLLSDGLYYTDR